MDSSLHAETSRDPNRRINTNAHRCNARGSLPKTQENSGDFSGSSVANSGRIAPAPISTPLSVHPLTGRLPTAPCWRPIRPPKHFSTALVKEGAPRRIATGVAMNSAIVGNALEGRFIERHTAPQATGGWLRTGSAIDTATSSTDGPWKPREPTTAMPTYGGLAFRVQLTRVAGREQELRNDDRAFRLQKRMATPQFTVSISVGGSESTDRLPYL